MPSSGHGRGGRGRWQGDKQGHGRGIKQDRGVKATEGDGSQKETRKFEAACEQIQKSTERYLATHQSFADEESDDDDEIEDEVLGQLLSKYRGEGELGRTEQFLQDAFRSGTQICLICIETLKKNDPIWNCSECFTSLHINCIQKWAKDSIFLLSQAREAHTDSNFCPVADTSLKWGCPKCRFKYLSVDIPKKYKCYCGKATDPTFDPWLIPHSCGEKCLKSLKPDCGHRCTLLCHPGPCPPCPVMVATLCYCGAGSPRPQRCCCKEWSCKRSCNRLLLCKQHRCADICHKGECAPCPRESEQKCLCGQDKQLRPCAQPTWQCSRVCGKYYTCGHHVCERICHSGQCGDCPNSGRRTCPCGKTTHILPCTEVVPTCGDTCSKLLSCGVHSCHERCHRGLCATCHQLVTKECRCGARKREVPCSKEFTCDSKCRRLRDCRKHTCNRKCCTGDCGLCEHPCNKTLPCGNHKCESRCHRGQCYPCPLQVKVSCTCGLTYIMVPCGREKKTALPRCRQLCQKPPDCHHPKREMHRCHVGPCPVCRIPCGKKLSCGHTCPAGCHTAVPVEIVENRIRAGPWEPVVKKTLIEKKLCPPCIVNVPIVCLGRHETSQFPCSAIRPYSCGRKCGRRLLCMNHSCELECHEVHGACEDGQAGTNCAPCENPCTKERPVGCTHKCPNFCHTGPCPVCNAKVSMKCHCGANSLTFRCHDWLTMGPEERDGKLSCAKRCIRIIGCGHLCTKKCHSGECSSPVVCQSLEPVRCSCKRIRKDFLCHVVTSGRAALKCDDMCIQILDAKRKAKERERAERAKRQAAVAEESKPQEVKPLSKSKYEPLPLKRLKKDGTEQWKQTKLIIASAVVLSLSMFLYFILAQL